MWKLQERSLLTFLPKSELFRLRLAVAGHALLGGIQAALYIVAGDSPRI